MQKKLYSLTALLGLLLVPMSVYADGSDGFAFCTGPTLNSFRLIGVAIIILKILVPLIIIGLGIMEFGKSMISAETKDIQHSIKSIIKRSMIGIFIFFIPTIILFFVGLVSDTDDVTSGLENNPDYTSNEDGFEFCSYCMLDPYGNNCERAMINTDDN